MSVYTHLKLKKNLIIAVVIYIEDNITLYNIFLKFNSNCTVNL